MPDTTGVNWDNTSPTDSGNVSDTGAYLREIKLEVEKRVNKEHVTLAGSSAGGEHKPGSAIAYAAASTFPTLRPDGVTAFTSADLGRLFVKTGTGELYYLDASGNFQHIVLASLTGIADGLLTKAKVASGFTLGLYPYSVLQDVKADGTDGGTFTLGAWRTRTLNTTLFDNGSNIISLTANQIELNSGVYRIRASAPAYQVDRHQLRFRDITNSVTIAYGTNAMAPAADTTITRAEVCAEFTVSADGTKFELQHYSTATKASNGFGLAVSAGVGEIYSMFELWKLL